MMRDKLTSLLMLAYEEEKKFIGGLDEGEKTRRGNSNCWAAKDIIAHIVYWQERVVASIEAVLNNSSPQSCDDLDTVNEAAFQAARDKSWDEVTASLGKSVSASVEMVSKIPADDILKNVDMPWQKGVPLWRIIAGNGFIHPLSHIALCRFEKGDTEYAVGIFEKTERLSKELSKQPEWLGVATYNLACGYALSGRHDRAIDELKKAFEYNPKLKEWSKEDSDLVSIREQDSYKALVEDGIK
jgi:tetratricopeptide (TPR) repeat protein